MEINQISIPYKYNEPVYIAPLGDIHWGSICVNTRTLDKGIKWICDRECYVVGMGDMIDAININDDRFDIKILAPEFRSNLDNLISDQYESLVEKLKEIPPERWIGIHTGNHEEKIRLKYYRDVTRDLCRALKTNYLGFEAWTKIRFERGNGSTKKHVEVFKLLSTHGSGGARYDSSKLGKVERICDKVDADLFMMGHVHSLQAGRGVRETINTSGSPKLNYKTWAWMITGTFLEKTAPGVITYAERMNLPAVKTGFPTFEIYPEGRRIHIRM